MLIKRFFVLIMLMTTQTLFSALTQDARAAQTQSNTTLRVQEMHDKWNQLLARAHEKCKQFEVPIPSTVQLTEEQRNEIAILKSQKKDIRENLKTGLFRTKRERGKLHARIYRRTKKIKLIQARAVLKVSDMPASQDASATETSDTFSLSIEQQEDINHLQNTIAGLCALHATENNIYAKNAIATYIEWLREKIRAIEAKAVLTALGISDNEEVNPAEVLSTDMANEL